MHACIELFVAGYMLHHTWLGQAKLIMKKIIPP